MSATTEHLFIEALSIPSKDRAALAHRLLRSLGSDDLSGVIEDAWRQEALDRCQTFDEGQLCERESDPLMRDLGAKLK
jgi:hypothetical protein